LGTSFAYTAYDKKRLFQIAHAAAKRLGDATLVIKAHPNEKEVTLRRFVSDIGMEHVSITKTMPLYALLLNN
jgi:hypothetical protein